MTHHSGGTDVTLSPEELAGDLPMVCVRTGRPADALAPVWFTRSPWWAWVPLAALCTAATVQSSWTPLATWWAAGALLLPVILSRGVTGQVPLDRGTRQRMAHVRARRFRVVMTALLLTWVAVGLWLLGSRAAGIVVLVAVVTLYLTAIAMALYGRSLTVRGRPQSDGSVILRRVHPAFVDALALRRTGHRP